MEKKYTILDSSFLQFTYEHYCEFCEDNGMAPADEDSREFTEWAVETARESVECDMENLKYGKSVKEHYPFFVEGTLGLWDGKHKMHYTKIFYGLASAIGTLMRRGYDDVKAEFDDVGGAVEFYGSHHDGTNCFTVRLLSAKGIKAIESARENDTIHDEFETKPEWFKKLKWSEVF